MKKITIALLVGVLQIFSLTLTAHGDDCSGGWRVMPNYNPAQGAPCQILGLNSRMGICQPGYAFETLCDDASNGRYKICQGSRSCGNPQAVAPPPPRQNDCTSWDYDHNRPCPRGYINRDCRGDCGPR